MVLKERYVNGSFREKDLKNLFEHFLISLYFIILFIVLVFKVFYSKLSAIGIVRLCWFANLRQFEKMILSINMRALKLRELKKVS